MTRLVDPIYGRATRLLLLWRIQPLQRSPVRKRMHVRNKQTRTRGPHPAAPVICTTPFFRGSDGTQFYSGHRSVIGSRSDRVIRSHQANKITGSRMHAMRGAGQVPRSWLWIMSAAAPAGGGEAEQGRGARGGGRGAGALQEGLFPGGASCSLRRRRDRAGGEGGGGPLLQGADPPPFIFPTQTASGSSSKAGRPQRTGTLGGAAAAARGGLSIGFCFPSCIMQVCAIARFFERLVSQNLYLTTYIIKLARRQR
jgi:hypothetical protein